MPFKFLSIALCICAASLSGVSAAETITTRSVITRYDHRVQNREWFLFVADGLEEPLRSSVANRIMRLFTEATPNDVIHLFRTPSHKPVLSVKIPDADPAVRLRMKRLRMAVARLGELLSSGKDGSLEINLPKVPASVMSVRSTSYPAAVVLAGNPLYLGAGRHEGFSMAHGLVPTDEVLQQSPAGHLSPFVAGVGDLPPNTFLSILAHKPDWGTDHMHEAAVTRAYRLMLQEKGPAYLIRITADVDSAFDLRGPQKITKVTPSRSEFGMQRSSMQSAQDYSSEEPLVVFLGHPKEKPPVYEIDPPEDVESLFEKGLASKDYTVLAARWHADASNLTFTDVDWRLTHPSDDKELKYDNRSTAFAKFLTRDVRYGVHPGGDSNAFGDNWEVCVVKNKMLPELEAWLNVYCGIGPLKVNVATFCNGERRDSFFTIPSRVGDEGEDSETRSDSRAWYQVPLPLPAPEIRREETIRKKTIPSSSSAREPRSRRQAQNVARKILSASHSKSVPPKPVTKQAELALQTEDLPTPVPVSQSPSVQQPKVAPVRLNSPSPDSTSPVPAVVPPPISVPLEIQPPLYLPSPRKNLYPQEELPFWVIGGSCPDPVFVN